MNKQRFIEQQIALGYTLHQHDGIWWQQQSPFHCKPAFRYETIVEGSSHPLWFRSIAGYSHLVPDGSPFNSSISVMMLHWDSKRLFEITDLSSSRRSKVRRGQKKNEIRLITNLQFHLEDLRKVVISTRLRTGVGNPVSYYFDHYAKWCKEMLSLFEMDDRFWWGAFIDGRFVAYYQTVLVESTLFIMAAKSHSDFLANYPNDTILFTVMSHALNELGCRKIEYGDWSQSDEKLFYFKQSYGFKKCDFPEYLHLNLISRPLLNIRRAKIKAK